MTLTIAVLGLVIALVSLTWQVITFAWSGSRVRGDTRFGVMESDKPIFMTSQDRLVRARGSKGFDDVALIAVIQNVGRLAVTIQECAWRTKVREITLTDNQLGTNFPHRLEPGAECLAIVEVTFFMTILDKFQPAFVGTIKTGGREVWPVVKLGNGRRQKGSVVEIPVDPEPESRRLGPVRRLLSD